MANKWAQVANSDHNWPQEPQAIHITNCEAVFISLYHNHFMVRSEHCYDRRLTHNQKSNQ